MKEFSTSEIEFLRGVYKSKKLVVVHGANFMGDRFQTSGFLLLSAGVNENYTFMNKDQVLLYQGQAGGKMANGQRKLSFLVLTPNFSKRHALCIEKITDESGNVLYSNRDFESQMQDVAWQTSRFWGVQEPALETDAVELRKTMIGKPIVVRGERTTLLGVGVEDSDGNIAICVCNGEKETVLTCKFEDIKPDRAASETIKGLVEKFAAQNLNG